jgi:hypothetical protein
MGLLQTCIFEPYQSSKNNIKKLKNNDKQWKIMKNSEHQWKNNDKYTKKMKHTEAFPCNGRPPNI